MSYSQFLWNKNKDKLMSKRLLAGQKYSSLLDCHSTHQFNNTLLLIDTQQFMSDSEEKSPWDSEFEDNDMELCSVEMELDEEEAREKSKPKKGGCTCKKTNCKKMYCECFAMGKICTPDCSCFGCHNHTTLAEVKPPTTNRYLNKGCNCKKSQCQKKYCECFHAGISCTDQCNCTDCLNGVCTSHNSKSNIEQLLL